MWTLMLVVAIVAGWVAAAGVTNYWGQKNKLFDEDALMCLFFWWIAIPYAIVEAAGRAGKAQGSLEVQSLRADIMLLKKEKEELRLRLDDHEATMPRLSAYR